MKVVLAITGIIGVYITGRFILSYVLYRKNEELEEARRKETLAIERARMFQYGIVPTTIDSVASAAEGLVERAQSKDAAWNARYDAGLWEYATTPSLWLEGLRSWG